MIKKNHANGISFESDTAFIFFGNRLFSNTNEILNENTLVFGKQTHDAKMNFVKETPHAGSYTFVDSFDGLYTNTPKSKLAIITADCIPCFILDDCNLYSLHLGWRSIEKGLFDSTLLKCQGKITVLIGPHIQQKSFEVESDVVLAFKKNMPKIKNTWFLQQSPTKYHISLQEILKLKSSHLDVNFISSDIDTYSSNDHNSYRRDHKTSQRNISFAFLKNRVK